jgi:hypothetical protein
MGRLELSAPSKARVVMDGLYKDMARRVESSSPGLCPVDMARAFEYYGAAEPPVRCGESHLSGLTEPLHLFCY